jgi:hypothetical protein
MVCQFNLVIRRASPARAASLSPSAGSQRVLRAELIGAAPRAKRVFLLRALIENFSSSRAARPLNEEQIQ